MSRLYSELIQDLENASQRDTHIQLTCQWPRLDECGFLGRTVRTLLVVRSLLGGRLMRATRRSCLEELKEFLLRKASLRDHFHQESSLDLSMSWHRHDELVFDENDVAFPLPVDLEAGLAEGFDFTSREERELRQPLRPFLP